MILLPEDEPIPGPGQSLKAFLRVFRRRRCDALQYPVLRKMERDEALAWSCFGVGLVMLLYFLVL